MWSTAGKDPPGTHMELLDDDQPTHVPEHPQPNAVLNEDPEPEEGPEQDDDDPHIIVHNLELLPVTPHVKDVHQIITRIRDVFS